MKRIRRKVTKIGNSLGVTFNREILTRIGVDVGDDVDVIVNESAGEIVLRKSQSLPQSLDARFFYVLQANVEQYRKTIEGLRDR